MVLSMGVSEIKFRRKVCALGHSGRYNRHTMRLSRKELACLLCLLAFAVTPASAATTYSSATDFFAVIGPDYYLESFDSLAVGTLLSGPLNFASGAYSYSASSGTEFYNQEVGSGDVAMSTNTALYSIVFTFLGANITAVGGNFWLTDQDSRLCRVRRF